MCHNLVMFSSRDIKVSNEETSHMTDYEISLVFVLLCRLLFCANHKELCIIQTLCAYYN